mgnify:FL=1
MKSSSILLVCLLLSAALASSNLSSDKDVAGNGTSASSSSGTNAAATNATARRRTLDPSNVYTYVDGALKEKYWYYLTKAELLYLSTLDQGNSTFMFLAIYRNIVGTFLSITTWTKDATYFQVNTLVRLGDGNGKKYGANYRPVAVKPLILRYNLGPGETVIEFTDCYDIKVNGKNINGTGSGSGSGSDSPLDTLCIAECKDLCVYARKRFWYYLDNAQVIFSSAAKTAVKNYCLINYLNHVGTFLVIGSNQDTSAVTLTQTNTFVRMGNGQDKDIGGNYAPVSFNKINLNLSE